MASIMEMSLMCRLCLAKDKNQVNIPIFEDPGDIRQIFVKISSCLPIKISRDDQLPKNICDGCGDKLELLYEFWNTSLDSEKTLTAWLKQVKDPAVSAVTQQISKPAETLVKEETDAAEASTYLEPAQESSINEEAEIEEVEPEEPPKKRARRTAAVKAQINIAPESDDEDDNFDNNMDEPDSVDADVIAKLEGESEESDGDEKDPSFADLPGTSTQDQPGTSGLGKDGAEAPKTKLKYKLTKKNTDSAHLDGALELPGKDNEILIILKTTEGYQCPYCPRYFSQRCKLKSHIIVHDNQRPFVCSICEKSFKHKRVLDYHEKTVHGESENFPCDVCGKVFGNKRNCVVHRSRHFKEHSVQCPICHKGFMGNFYLRKHMVVHSEERPLQCPVCDKTFKHQRVLDYHYKTLHDLDNQEKYPCDICGRTFSTKRNCEVHRRRHIKDFDIFCEYCGKGFLNNFYLKKHLDTKHLGKRHICDICGASIGDKGNLRNHMKLHDPNYQRPPPEVCQICNKPFSNLKRHYKAAHENDGKNFKCDFCGKFFRGKDGLKFHLMVHRNEKPFACTFCDKKFILNTFLQQHLRTHPESNVKPFECKFCQKTFIKKSLLEHHLNTHTGARPFQCESCSKNFTSKKYLNSHVRSQHNDNPLR